MESCVPKFLRFLQLQNPFTRTGKRRRHNQGAYEIRTDTCDRLRNKTSDIIACDNCALDSKLFQKGDDPIRLAWPRIDLFGIGLMLVRLAEASQIRNDYICFVYRQGQECIVVSPITRPAV